MLPCTKNSFMPLSPPETMTTSSLATSIMASALSTAECATWVLPEARPSRCGREPSVSSRSILKPRRSKMPVAMPACSGSAFALGKAFILSVTRSAERAGPLIAAARQPREPCSTARREREVMRSSNDTVSGTVSCSAHYANRSAEIVDTGLLVTRLLVTLEGTHASYQSCRGKQDHRRHLCFRQEAQGLCAGRDRAGCRWACEIVPEAGWRFAAAVRDCLWQGVCGARAASVVPTGAAEA